MPDDMPAATTTPSQPRSRLTYAGIAVAVLLPIAGSVAIVETANFPSSDPARRGVTVAMPPSTAPSTKPTTDERLLTIAERITAAPGDDTFGRYEYRHSRTWMLTSTGRPAPRPMTTAVFSRDDRRWVASDASGTVTAVEVGPDYTLAGADPDYRSTDTEFTRNRAVTTTHPARELGGSITGPIPTDPLVLARSLAAVDPTRTGPEATIIDVQDLFAARYVPPPARATVLRVLADVPGLEFHDQVTDRLGRTGIAVSLETDTSDAPALRHSLIIDPATGQLLAYEQRLTAREPDLKVPAGQIYLYHLFIDSSKTDHRRA